MKPNTVKTKIPMIVMNCQLVIDDFSGGSNPYSDDFGHGTFVAGLIAGNGASSNGAYKGVAPKAKLVSIKIAGRDGSSDITMPSGKSPGPARSLATGWSEGPLSWHRCRCCW